MSRLDRDPAWLVGDRVWFRAHPGRRFMLRRFDPSETFGQPVTGDVNATLVEQIEPGARMRRPSHVPEDLLAARRSLTDADLEPIARGCVPITEPAPRWSDYIHRLRKVGVIVFEPHDGAYPGHHGRYVLRVGGDQ